MGWDNELREASLRIQTLGVCGSHFPKAGFMKMQSQGRQAGTSAASSSSMCQQSSEGGEKLKGARRESFCCLIFSVHLRRAPERGKSPVSFVGWLRVLLHRARSWGWD